MTKYKYHFFIRSSKSPHEIEAVVLCNKHQAFVQDLIYQAIKDYENDKEIPLSAYNKMTYVLWFLKSKIDCELINYHHFSNLFI